MEINVLNAKMSDQEQQNYADYLQRKYPNIKITNITIQQDGDYVNLFFTYDAIPFERIRRITGYLTGSVDRWNDAKQAELYDRVKHG